MYYFTKWLALCISIVLLSACQNSNQETTENTSNSDPEEVVSTIEKPTNLPIETKQMAGCWYEGKIDKYPIWLYLIDERNAVYGYNSTNGAAIFLRMDMLMKTLNAIEADEEFDITYDKQTGKLSGVWKQEKKELNVELSPLNQQPESAKDLLGLAPEFSFPIQLPFEQVNQSILKANFQNKNWGAYASNLHEFIKEVESIDGQKTYKVQANGGRIFFKHPIAKDRYALYLSLNLKDEMVYKGTSLKAENVRVLALMDSKGTLQKAICLGNESEKEALEFDLKVNSRKELELSWIKVSQNEALSKIFEGAERLRYKIDGAQLKEIKKEKIQTVSDLQLDRYKEAEDNILERSPFDGTGMTKAMVWDQLTTYKSIDDFFTQKPKIVKEGHPVLLVGAMGSMTLTAFSEDEIIEDFFDGKRIFSGDAWAKVDLGDVWLIQLLHSNNIGFGAELIVLDKASGKVISRLDLEASSSNAYSVYEAKTEKIGVNSFKQTVTNSINDSNKEEIEEYRFNFNPETNKFERVD